jgi:GH35 family endo-1,4-beta-xylanase
MRHMIRLSAPIFSLVLLATFVSGATLRHQWSFDEGSGNTVGDAIGSADMQIEFSSSGWVTGRVGGAYTFNGNDHAVTINRDQVTNPSGGVAISGWFRTRSNTANRSWIFQVEREYGMRIRNGSLQLSFRDAVTSAPQWGGDLDDGLWHHFVAQNDGTTTELYVDGQLVGRRAEVLNSLTGESKDTAIAAKQNGGNEFAGSFDEFRYYEGTLTLAEIQTLALISDQPPTAKDDAYSGAVNTRLSVAAPGVLANDQELDGDVVTALLEEDAAQGTLNLASDGSFTFDPPTGFVGDLSFTYRAVDTDGSSNVATVSLTILDPIATISPAEVAQIETDLGINLSTQEILDLSAIVKPQSLPAWRADANLRIESHRKADLTVEVVDSQGSPVPGADVRLELKNHAFNFSGIVTVMDLTDANSDLSDAGSTTEDWERITKALFNRLGLNNGFKPKLTNQHQYIPGFMSWAAANGLDVRGHLLIWPGGGDVETIDSVSAVSGDDYGNHLSTASTSDYASYDVLGALETYKASARSQSDKDALEAEVDAEIQEWVSQWDVYEWDVINEPINNQLLMEILGYDQMAEWFKIADAHKVRADAKLFVNDYQIASAKFTGTSYETRRDIFFNHLDRIIADAGPIDGIGFQSRFKFLDGYDPAVVYARIEEFANRYPQLEITGTEFEVKDNYNFFTGELVEAYDEITRARVSEEVITTYFSHDQVTGLSAWDYINPEPDGTDNAYSRALVYYGDGPGGVDGPIIKLNGLVWYYLHRIRYHNDVSETTVANGEVSLRGFKGQQTLTVTYDGKDYVVPVALLADGSQQVVLDDVTLATAPTEKTIERWDFDDVVDTEITSVVNTGGTAAFTESFDSIATDGSGSIVIGQSAFITEQFDGDFVAAEPLTNGARSTGVYELEFVISELDFSSGDPNGASVGFGFKDFARDEELFVVRLNKNVGGLAISTFIDTTYTQLQFFNSQFVFSEPVKIRSIIDLDAGVADVYTTIGSAPEEFRQQVSLSAVATTWDQVLFAIQNNQTDWGATDFVKIDYVQVRKLQLDNFDLWKARTNWGAETLQAPMDNPDGDEMVNFLEFVLGGDPLVNDWKTVGPKVEEHLGAPHYTFTLGVDSIDIELKVEHSSDLVDWKTIPPTLIKGQPGDLIQIPLIDPEIDTRFSRLFSEELQ